MFLQYIILQTHVNEYMIMPKLISMKKFKHVNNKDNRAELIDIKINEVRENVNTFFNDKINDAENIKRLKEKRNNNVTY